MGCGGSVNGEVVAPEPEDPLQKLLGEIHAEQEKLKEILPPFVECKHEMRFLKNNIKKLRKVGNNMHRDTTEDLQLYSDLKLHIADRDAYQLREASVGFGTDESGMAQVIVARCKENIDVTDELYQARFGRTLEDQIRGENKTLLGLITGSLTHFGKFLTYITMSPAKRDAFLIHKCMAGFGCSDYILMEILSTRTNAQLKAAAEVYAEDHDGEDMVERIKSETGGFGKKWYGLWVDTLVEFDRDESLEVQGDPAELAQQLYDAGAGKWMGCDEQVFIDILCKANEPTCIAIAQAYEELEQSERSLREDVEKEMGGDLEFACLARVMPKLQFLAVRIYKACKGWGTDEECISRVISCLDKHEAAGLETTYNEMYAEMDEPYNDFRALLSSELSGSFLESIFAYMDTSPPKGHRAPETSYDRSAAIAGRDFRQETDEKYCRDTAVETAQKKMNGKMKLSKVDSPFLRDGYDRKIKAKKDVYEPPNYDHLLNGADPEELEAAEAMLAELKEATAFIETKMEKVTGKLPDKKERYHEFCEKMREREHLLRQYQDDNNNMLEFCAERDADLVHAAVDGWGTDEDKLIRTLCSLQKVMIRRVDAAYQEKFGKSLREVTDDELGGFFEGDFKYTMKCLLTPDAELDAELLEESMKGLGTDDNLLCEIVCTRSNDELEAAREAFEQRTGKSVFDWVEGDTSGGYQEFLLECLKGERDEDDEANHKLAKKQAKKLQKNGIGEGDIDAKVMCNILADASVAQVEAIKAEYEMEFGTPMMEVIAGIGGDWERALLARCYDQPTYYAITLEKAMKGLGTDDKTLARIVGRTSHGVMKEVIARYEELHGRSLRDAIDSETSGNYRKALLTMLFAEKPGAEADPAEGAGEEE